MKKITKNTTQNNQISKWSFEELRDLCRRRGVPESTIYQTSLEWRWRRADFHAEKAEEIWKELFSTSFSTGEQRFYEEVFSYEAHAEACIQSLHSMADLLGQIINVVILQKRFKEDQVSLKKLAKCSIPLQIAETG